MLQHEVDVITKGIELSWTTWGKMRGENLVLGDISYLKSETDKGFERIFSVIIEENQAYRIGQMIAYIKAGILPGSMLITPSTKPANLAEILSRKGFVIDDADPCMMMYLGEYKRMEATPAGFTISQVKEISRLEEWLNIVSTALFGGELVTLEQLSDVLDNTYLYLGVENGKPVTACMTISDGDTSVLEMVATLKEHRRKGFASAVIDAALVDLQNRGVKTISLRAQADGVGVYEMLGFKACFKRIVATFNRKNVFWLIEKKQRIRVCKTHPYTRCGVCPCQIGEKAVQKAMEIYRASDDVASFVAEMERQRVIGKRIWYDEGENTIFIAKIHACDCGGGRPKNKTLIGQHCHCNHYNRSKKFYPKHYCKCGAEFYRPMFAPMFGANMLIEPYQTVLSGDNECVMAIKIGKIEP